MGGQVLDYEAKRILNKGREERDQEKIREMLDDGKLPEEIAEFCHYPIEQVNSVQNSMLSTAK